MQQATLSEKVYACQTQAWPQSSLSLIRAILLQVLLVPFIWFLTLANEVPHVLGFILFSGLICNSKSGFAVSRY